MMKVLMTWIAVGLCVFVPRTQSAVRAEQPWRFLTLADWHLADIYVMPDKYPGAVERTDASFGMLKKQYGGGSSCFLATACRPFSDVKAFPIVSKKDKQSP